VQGGGPYGQQVTRGQDLTGKDFSGQTLIKQDFKTVRTCTILPSHLSSDRLNIDVIKSAVFLLLIK
jgi:hypothetical protein